VSGHARRKFAELLEANASALAGEAVQRIAAIYRIERETTRLKVEVRLARRPLGTQALWEELHPWLQLERRRARDGSATAQAIDDSLNHWAALARNMHDGAVSVDNHHLEDQMRPGAMGRKARLFAGSELAGQRAPTVMSLAQLAKLNGHDPRAFLEACRTRQESSPVPAIAAAGARE
jgi:transposase